MKENLTPLMKQYEELKAAHSEEILLFRLGDFYEMFGEDAKRAAPILDLALTQRQGLPMCGIPYHAIDRYLPKLLKNGLRIAIAEQMEDAETAKGLVKRDVIRVVSPGTVIEENLLLEKENNFLAAIALDKNKKAAIASLDVSTGEFLLQEFELGQNLTNLLNELAKISPAEILLPQGTEIPTNCFNGIAIHVLEKSKFKSFSTEKSLELLNSHPLAQEAARMVLFYLQKLSPSFLENLSPPKWVDRSNFMTLDRETIQNLEILKNSYDQTAEKTLLSFLDRTLTPMGGRLLKQWLIHPLLSLEAIQQRLETVDFLLQEYSLRKNAGEALKDISDMERITARIVAGSATPRDCLGLKISLGKIETLRQIFPELKEDIPEPLKNILNDFGNWREIISLLNSALVENPPIFLDKGGVIRAGYDAVLDEKRRASEEGKNWLAELEKREREKTQISTLKVGYTSIFGYYLEVTKAQVPKVPRDWHRKQTLVNAERYITDELKELEQKIVGAEEQALRIEKKLFQEILTKIKEKTAELQIAAKAIAQLDCFLSYAEVADSKGLVKPEMDESQILELEEAWHPVVKDSLPSGAFVPNDLFLDGKENQIMILTGPNMSGKSTYLRQAALIILMAQIGSFVPAKKARIGIVDRVFTRIGSADRLAQGESTFMVEMQETARILSCATTKSFIILDEVGRGTSTYDGISIAWAVVEYLAGSKQIASSKKLVASSEDNSAVDRSLLATGYSLTRPKVMFATHYFELTHLAEKLEGVKNYNVQAKEWQEHVIFLHKIVPGPADRSYGIHVAKLAGLPQSVIGRAKKILSQLEKKQSSMLKSKVGSKQELLNFYGD